MRPLIAGNWKMHGLAAQLREIETMAATVHADPPAADVLICVPAVSYTHLDVYKRQAQSGS